MDSMYSYNYQEFGFITATAEKYSTTKKPMK